MAFTWLQLARAGAPPASAHTAELVADNRRKVFAKPPTRGADGELHVEPAVFKPRPRNKPPASVSSSSAPSARPARPAAARPVGRSAASTFPTAVSHLLTHVDEDDHDSDDDDDDDETVAGVASRYELVDELTTRHHCDAVRRMIQRFLARKTMTQSAFLRAIQVNHNSFTKFMSYSGRDKGRNNKTYPQALLFFHENGHPEDAAVAHGGPASATAILRDKESGKPSRKEQALMADAFFGRISRVPLPEPVAVYDDCDDVREKLNALIESKTITQSALLRHLNVTTNTLRRFLAFQGKREGCTMNLYRQAYIMFEKLRIAQGQPKTPKRLQTERDVPDGYSLRRDAAHDDASGGHSPQELTR